MKKEYNSPDFDIVSLSLKDVLVASQYTPEAEDPTRGGDDSGGGELFGGFGG